MGTDAYTHGPWFSIDTLHLVLANNNVGTMYFYGTPEINISFTIYVIFYLHIVIKKKFY